MNLSKIFGLLFLIIIEFTDYDFICGITITFELHGGFSLKLRDEYIEHATTSPSLDATIIEITNELMLKLTRLGLNFLQVKLAETDGRINLISQRIVLY